MNTERVEAVVKQDGGVVSQGTSPQRKSVMSERSTYRVQDAAVGTISSKLSGDANPVATPGLFSTVTPEQFGAAMIGFLTYRVPLFISQLTPVLSESATDMMPGSAAMAMRMASDAKKRGVDMSALNESPVTKHTTITTG